MFDKLILEPHYLPTIRFFTYFYHSKKLIIDDESLFEKQSFRNRTYISGANGPLCLIVPVKKGKTKQAMRDVKIDYSSNWPHIHWTSIFSAYNNSPFFEHYSSYFKPYYFKKYTYLMDMNIDLINEVSQLINLESEILLLTENKDIAEIQDFRNNIHPKEKYDVKDKLYAEQEYIQVFSDRYGFQKNLSILDLIFSEGPNSESLLQTNLRF